MTGSGAGRGFEFQEKVTAAVMVHVLAGLRLPWIRMEPPGVPTAVLAETDTAGDDILIELLDSNVRIDVQAKRGLKRGEKLYETLDKFIEGLASTDDHFVLAVDGTTSGTIRNELREDLQRMGEGRFDPLSDIGQEVLERVENVLDREVTTRIHVVELEILTDWAAARQRYVENLRRILEDPAQAETAWEILSNEAHRLISDRGRATERTLRSLLVSRNVRLQSAEDTDAGFRSAVRLQAWDAAVQVYSEEGEAEGHVTAVRRLLDHGQPEAALALISRVEKDAELRMPTQRQSTLLALRGVAKLRLGDLEGAKSDCSSAIELDTGNAVAHANLSALLLESGDTERAEAHAKKAVETDPTSPTAWARRFIVAEHRGEQVELPPEVADSPQIAIARMQLAAHHEDWGGLQAEYDAFEASSVFSNLGVDRRVLVAHLLQQRALALCGGEREHSLREALNHAREAVTQLRQDRARKPLQRVLVLQGQLEMLAELTDEARETLNDALTLDPENWLPAFLLAQLKYTAGEPGPALSVLDRYRGPDSMAPMIALRAECLLALDRRKEAREILQRLMGEDRELSYEDGLMVAEAALSAGLLDLAETIVEELQHGDGQQWFKELMAARLAIARGDEAAGLDAYQTAAACAPPKIQNEIEIEHAKRLQTAGRTAEAIEHFRRADVLSRGSVNAKRSYVFSLLELGRWSEAAVELDTLTDGDPPLWVLELQAELANRRGDPEGAEEALRRILAIEPDRLDAAINLGIALLRQDRIQECSQLADETRAAGNASSAKELIHLARLFANLRRFADAIQLALLAVRKDPSDEVQLAFLNICLADPHTDTPDLQVGPGTAVTLEEVSNGRQTLEYVIVDESIHGPCLEGEITTGDPIAERLDGLSVGDSVKFREGSVAERNLTVQSVLPLNVHTFQKVYKEYARLHPESNSFRTFLVGSEPDLSSLAPIIGEMTAQEARATAVINKYDEIGLPLGTVATVIGRGVSDVYAHLANRDEGYLATEHSDSGLYEAAVALARDSASVILTRSGLLTARELSILEYLPQTFEEIVVPQSLLDGLELEIRAIERVRDQGRGTIGTRGGQLYLAQETPETTEAVQDILAETREWVRDTAVVRPVPITALNEAPSTYRRYLDEISYDCLALSGCENLPMYADDLGLRRVSLPSIGDGSGFSTTALLDALLKNSLMDAESLARYRGRLVELRHYWVPINAETLYQGLFDVGFQPNQSTIELFERLQGVHCETSRAVSIGVDLLSRVALSTAAGSSRVVARLLVESVTTGRRPIPVLRALRAHAHDRLHLLPLATDELDRAMRDYLEARELT